MAGIDAGLVEFEHRRVVKNLASFAVADLVQMHRLGKAAANVEELQAKRQACVAHSE